MTELGSILDSYRVFRSFAIPSRVNFHADGIAFRPFWRRVGQCRWEQVHEFYARYIALPATHPALRTSKHKIEVPLDDDRRIVADLELKCSVSLRHVANFRIVCVDGTQMRMRGYVNADPETVLNSIYARIGQRLFRIACEQLASGTPVTFGEVEATTEGLHCGESTLSWTRIRKVFDERSLASEFQPDLVFNDVILNKHLRRRWWHAMRFPNAGYGSHRVANLRTLWKLVEHVCTSEPSSDSSCYVPSHDVSSHPTAKALAARNRRRPD